MGRTPSDLRRTHAAVCIVAAVSLLGACQQQTQDVSDDQASVDDPQLNLPVVPRPQPPIDRAAILAAVARAASASASGTDDKAAQAALDGRQFEFRIRFGCKGPSSDLPNAWLGWSFEREKGTLRVRAMPTISPKEQLVKALGGDQFEAVEGFWVPRPWLLEPICPATAALSSAPAEPATDNAADQLAEESVAAAEPEPAPPRVGIAQFFTDTDARTGRRSLRPYEAVKTLDADQPIGAQGFNLVLSGRLKQLPDKGVIACVAKGAESPPECILSVDFDRVWIEKPSDGEIIAEWGGG